MQKKISDKEIAEISKRYSESVEISIKLSQFNKPFGLSDQENHQESLFLSNLIDDFFLGEPK